MTPALTIRSGASATAVIALGAIGLLALAPAAEGAGDPVAGGHLKLGLSPSFKHRLAREGVKMSPKAFAVDSGALNPMTGKGTLKLKGRLRFRAGGRKVVFKTVTARLGSHGILKTGGVKMFRLRGRAVERNGFGAEIKDLSAKLTGEGARKLNRRLGLHSLRRMRAGKLSIAEQPQTVAVTGGTVRLTPASDPRVPGTVVSKLAAHCIKFDSGNTAIAPAVKVGTATPSYDFPVSGGTIGPQGNAGTVEASGGLRIANNNASSPPSDHCDTVPPPLASLSQTELAFNLLDNYVSTHATVAQLSGTVPTAGDQGVAAATDLEPASATVSANPADHTVAIRGIVATINKGSALVLNQTFRQPTDTYSGAAEFNSGDLFGTIEMTVTTR